MEDLFAPPAYAWQRISPRYRSLRRLTTLLAPRCERLLAVDAVEAAVRTAGDRLAGQPHVTLRVAAMPRLAGGLLARAVARFRSEHPDVIVAIHSGDDETVNGWIASGFCDAALTMLYGETPDARLDHVETRACVATVTRCRAAACPRGCR